MKNSSRLAISAFVTLAAMSSGQALAADISVLSGGAVKSSVMPLIRLFASESGDAINIDFSPVGAILKKLNEGAKPDVVIMTSGAIARIEKEGKIVPGTASDLARTRIGVAVREGTPIPDVSSVAALRETLLRAKSVAYIDPASGGTSGIHFAGVLKKLGIDGEVNPKAVLVKGGFAAESVARGEAQIVVH